MRITALLWSALLALTGVKTYGQAATTPPDGYAAEAKKQGYRVEVEFYVDSAGTVTNAKVLESEEPVLNSFALASAQAGRLNPSPLPAVGSEPKHVTSDLVFPVESYDSGKPLPAGVALPKPRFQPSPAYPFEYHKKGITGGVWMSITVGKTGKVIDCKVIKASHPDFAPAATQAVSKWVFIPATFNGKPMEVTFNVPLSFEIEGKSHGWRWLVAPQPSMPGFSVVSNGP